MPFMKKIGSMFRTILLANGGLILLFCFFFGLHFYRSLRPLAAGIEDLAKEESIHLQEKGMTGELAEKLNQISERLERQKAVIEARDTARTNWIAGVSHDIRTPLSMIMGYAEQLLSAENLRSGRQKRVRISGCCCRLRQRKRRKRGRSRDDGLRFQCGIHVFHLFLCLINEAAAF